MNRRQIFSIHIVLKCQRSCEAQTFAPLQYFCTFVIEIKDRMQYCMEEPKRGCRARALSIGTRWLYALRAALRAARAGVINAAVEIISSWTQWIILESIKLGYVVTIHISLIYGVYLDNWQRFIVSKILFEATVWTPDHSVCYTDDVMQDCSNSIANALELLQSSCTKASIQHSTLSVLKYSFNDII